MDIQLKQGNITEEAADLIVVNLFQGVTQPGGATGAVDRALGGAISDVIAAGDFTGKSGETLVLYTPRGASPRAACWWSGWARRPSSTCARARNAAATAARKARDLGVKTVATIVHGAGIGGLDPAAAAAALVEGTRLGLYRFEGYRSKPPKDWKPDPETLTVLGLDPAHLAAFQAGIARAEAVAAGVTLARDLVNTPANHMTPTIMAERAGALAAGDRAAVRGAGPRRVQGAGHGHLHGRGRGIGTGAQAHHPGAQRRPGRPAHRRAGRQGRHLRLRRHLAQAGRRDVEDEGRHGRRGRGDRGAGRGRPAEPAAARRGPGAVRREPARRPRAEARRRLHRHDRQDDGGHQHRRRGPHAAGRRAGLCRAASTRPRWWTSPP